MILHIISIQPAIILCLKNTIHLRFIFPESPLFSSSYPPLYPLNENFPISHIIPITPYQPN